MCFFLFLSRSTVDSVDRVASSYRFAVELVDSSILVFECNIQWRSEIIGLSNRREEAQKMLRFLKVLIDIRRTLHD